MSRIETWLDELGLSLPPEPTPGGNYLPAVQCGRLLFVAGNLPVSPNASYKGRVGAELTVEEGYEAARLCALNCLARARSVVRDLDRIDRVVKVLGFVNAAPGFDRFLAVLDGASDLMVALFGNKGRHTRSALGAAVVDNYAVEVEMVLELKE